MSPGDTSFQTLYHAGADVPPHPDAITVAVSLYNYQSFITECLDSILRQTHEPIEIVVVDDHSLLDQSADTACAWLKSHADRFTRVVLLRHDANYGLAAARNTAFEAARTGYVFVIDADNSIYPRALARLYAAVQDHPYDVVYSQLEIFGATSGLAHADVWSRRRFQRGNYVDAMALVSKRSVLQAGGYTHIEGGWEDYDLWCKFIELGMTGLFVPEILCRYRVHGSSMLRTATAKATEQLKVELMIRHPWLDIQ